MKIAIVALLAGSAAAFAPASVNKVRSHPFDGLSLMPIKQ